MPGKKGFPLLTAFLLALLLFLRLFLLTADPPYDLSTSGGPYGDPGGYSFNARNHVLFGTWEVDDYNMMYLSFPPHLMTFLSFKLLGVGLFQQNLVPVLFSLGSLFLFFLILRSRFSYAWALAGTCLLGFNYQFLMYSRVANRVMPPLFFILLGLYFLQKKSRAPGFLLAAGMSFLLALISKSVVFYVLASIGIGYMVYVFLHHKIKEIAKQIVFLAIGVLAPGFLWLYFIYIPHKEFIHSFSELNVKFLIPPAHFPTLMRNFWTRPPILLEQMPIICLLAALASLVMLFNLVRKSKKIALIDWIFLVWFLVGYVYYALIQQRVPRHVIPHIIPLIFLTISFGHHLLERSSIEEKKPRFFLGLLLFLWLLFPVSMGLKYLAKLFPQIFTGQQILNLALLVLSAGLVFLYFVCVKIRSGKKTEIVSFSFKRILVFTLLSAILILQGHRYIQWAIHPQFQFKQVSQDLGKAFPRATIAGLWAPVISLENKHRAHEYFPGAINDYPNFFERFGITHVFTTRHAGEDKKFEQNFPDVMAGAKLLARYHMWTVEALLYDIHPESIQADLEGYEAELFTQKGNTPRFDPEASGSFAVFSRGKQQRFVVSIPDSHRLSEGTYDIAFRMKKQGSSRKADQRMARVDAVYEKRKKAIAYKDVYSKDLSDTVYQNIRMTMIIKSAEDITFRVFTQGNGDIWVDRIDIQKRD
jgi:4-amino-4-deoxy-L-arabinose transferase-like glycosyltransferase